MHESALGEMRACPLLSFGGLEGVGTTFQNAHGAPLHVRRAI